MYPPSTAVGSVDFSFASTEKFAPESSCFRNASASVLDGTRMMARSIGCCASWVWNAADGGIKPGSIARAHKQVRVLRTNSERFHRDVGPILPGPGERVDGSGFNKTGWTRVNTEVAEPIPAARERIAGPATDLACLQDRRPYRI